MHSFPDYVERAMKITQSHYCIPNRDGRSVLWWRIGIMLFPVLLTIASCGEKKKLTPEPSVHAVPGNQPNQELPWLDELRTVADSALTKGLSRNKLLTDQAAKELSAFLRGFPERTINFHGKVRTVTETQVILDWDETIFGERHAEWIKRKVNSGFVSFGELSAPDLRLIPSFSTSTQPELWRYLESGAKVNMAAKIFVQPMRNIKESTFMSISIGLVMCDFVLLPEGAVKSDFESSLPRSALGRFDPSDPLEMHAESYRPSIHETSGSPHRLTSFQSCPITAGYYMARFRSAASARVASGNSESVKSAEEPWEKACELAEGYRISWPAKVVSVMETHALIAYPESARAWQWNLYSSADNVPFSTDLMRAINTDTPGRMFDSVKWAEIAGDKARQTVQIARMNRPSDEAIIPQQFYEVLRLADYPWLRAYKSGDLVGFDAPIVRIAHGERHALTSNNFDQMIYSLVVTFGVPRIYPVAGGRAGRH